MSTVLLVDDDVFVRKLVGAFLERSGFAVLAAEDSASAIELARLHEGTIQVLITDFQMPGASGVELAGFLSESRPGLKVVLISAMGADRVAVPDDWEYLQKPFQPAVLLEMLAGFNLAPRAPGKVPLSTPQA